MKQESISRGIAEQFSRNKTAIVQMLNEIQDHYGFLPMEEMTLLSDIINLPLSKIWGIVTFYSHYKLKRPAENPVRVCSGTACHVKSSSLLKEVFESKLDGIPEEKVSVENVACLGCCALAPVFEVNGGIYGGMTKKKVEELAEAIMRNVEV